MTTHSQSDQLGCPEREIVAVRKADAGGHEHTVAVKLRGGVVEDAADVLRAIRSHEAHYVMRPPEGAGAYRDHQETGLLLLVQTRPCPDCNQEVLYA